ncbi:2,4-dihydroxyhept-2-enedioate aldolase [Paracidovorax citrulli AAC00-1]|uniref:2,4-dihydroxyhept-2-enedioate aldolase n=2 Tax=Paracidovorax citrulli TaxID=80869 RepID=A1TNX4_PARC0|nr:2,4-dihydroxyhept-2-enedioate aldolase [Paracidovorax citrulli AAC00-1]
MPTRSPHSTGNPPMPAHNPFKAALAARQPQIGLWLSMADPYLAEAAATTGYDWLLIDGEHAPNDLRSTLGALQAVAPYPSQPVVRIAEGSTALIKQVLDIGARTLLVPMVDTPEQARAIAAATQYPPHGIRGVGSAVGRVSQWSGRADYLAVADDEVCLLVQAETVTALRNLPAICAVEGVHGIFIGPADLAASMGHRGNPGHPEVQAAIEDAMRTIVASGKAAGTLTSDPALAQRYLDLGCTFVAVGVDVLMFVGAARKLRAQFSGAGDTVSAKPNAAY